MDVDRFWPYAAGIAIGVIGLFKDRQGVAAVGLTMNVLLAVVQAHQLGRAHFLRLW